MSIFGGGDMPKFPKPTPVAPRLSDTQLKSKDEMNKTKARQGIEDQILSLGRKKNQPGMSSLLGRAPNEAANRAAA